MSEGAPKPNISPELQAIEDRKAARAEEIKKRDDALEKVMGTQSKELGRHVETRKTNPDSAFYEHTKENGIATRGELRRTPEKGFDGWLGGIRKRVEVSYNGWLRPGRVTEKVTKNLKVSMMRLGRADKKAVKWSGKLGSANDRLEDVTTMIAELEAEQARTAENIGLDDGVGESYRKERARLEKERVAIFESREKIQGKLEGYNAKKTNMQERIEQRVGQRLERIEKWRGPLQEKYDELRSKEKELKRRVNARQKEYKGVAAKIEVLNERLKNADNKAERKTIQRALKATRRLRALESKQLQPELNSLHALQHDLDFVYKKLRVWEKRANKVRHAAELPSSETPVGPREHTPVDEMSNVEGLDDDSDEEDEIETMNLSDENEEDSEGASNSGESSGESSGTEGGTEASGSSSSEDTERGPYDGWEMGDGDEPADSGREGSERDAEPSDSEGAAEEDSEGTNAAEVDPVSFASHKEKMLGVLNEARNGFRIGQSDEHLKLAGRYPFEGSDSVVMREALGCAQTPEGKRYYELATLYKEAEETGSVASECYTAFALDGQTNSVDSSSAFQRAWGALSSIWEGIGKEDESYPDTIDADFEEVPSGGTESSGASERESTRELSDETKIALNEAEDFWSRQRVTPQPFSTPPAAVGIEPILGDDTEGNKGKEGSPDTPIEATPQEMRGEEISIRLNQLRNAMGTESDELSEISKILRKKREGNRTVLATPDEIREKITREGTALSSTQIEYLELVIEKKELGQRPVATEANDSEKNTESFSQRKNAVDKVLAKNRREVNGRGNNEILKGIDAWQAILRAEDKESAAALTEVAKQRKGDTDFGGSALRVRRYLLDNTEHLSDSAKSFLSSVTVFYEREAKRNGEHVPYLKNGGKKNRSEVAKKDSKEKTGANVPSVADTLTNVSADLDAALTQERENTASEDNSTSRKASEKSTKKKRKAKKKASSKKSKVIDRDKEKAGTTNMAEALEAAGVNPKEGSKDRADDDAPGSFEEVTSINIGGYVELWKDAYPDYPLPVEYLHEVAGTTDSNKEMDIDILSATLSKLLKKKTLVTPSGENSSKALNRYRDRISRLKKKIVATDL